MRAVCLLLALAACAEPPLTQGLSSALGEAIYGCDRLGPPTRDWCVVAGIPNDQGTGTEIRGLCDRLSDQNARDRCLELSVRHASDPAPPATCAEVHSRRWQEICWLEAAAQAAPRDLASAAGQCARAGTHRDACLEALIESRLDTWKASDPDIVQADVKGLLGYSRRLRYDEKFGARIGVLVQRYRLLGREGLACGAFPSGTGRMACELAFREGDAR